MAKQIRMKKLIQLWGRNGCKAIKEYLGIPIDEPIYCGDAKECKSQGCLKACNRRAKDFDSKS
jgi:hypothetical protein